MLLQYSLPSFSISGISYDWELPTKRKMCSMVLLLVTMFGGPFISVFVMFLYTFVQVRLPDSSANAGDSVGNTHVG